MFSPRTSWLAFLVMLLATPVFACLWDYDTLRDERRGLPGIAEILAGKWERHSELFYRRRVEDMKALLAADPKNLDAYDNLAVALEKLGDQDAAIEVMGQKEKLKPGEYTTYANLGTFYLHKGDFENGIRSIEQALAINPDAHFGREEHQLKLAKYLYTIRRDGKPQPLEDFLGITFLALDPEGKVYAGPGMARGGPDVLATRGIKPNAFDGIVGMIRFGTGKSPDLFYALGNLLVLRGDKQLALRAYDRAIQYDHPRAADIELLKAELNEYLETNNQPSTATIAQERTDAEAWVQAFQRYEDDLVRAGKNIEDEANYADFYRQHGPAQAPIPFAVSDWMPKDPIARAAIFLAEVLIGSLIAIFALRTLLRRRKRRRAAQAPATVV